MGWKIDAEMEAEVDACQIYASRFYQKDGNECVFLETSITNLAEIAAKFFLADIYASLCCDMF